MSLHLFAGLRVREFQAARAWYERLLGEPTFLAHATEAVWTLAEMTDRNPNVFYETGYAHGLAKPVILLTSTADDIPFDLRHYPHVAHGGSITTLKERLEQRIRWCLDNPD